MIEHEDSSQYSPTGSEFNEAVGSEVEEESTTDLIYQMTVASRTLRREPAKQVVVGDMPANGFASLKHNYGRKWIQVFLIKRKDVAPNINDVFFMYKLGNTKMYTQAALDRDAQVYQQYQAGETPWQEFGYGGASAQMTHKLMDQEIEVVDEKTRKLRKGTYPELIVQLAREYTESQEQSAQQAIKAVLDHPNEFTSELQILNRIRIKGELGDILSVIPEEDRKTIHLHFDFVEYDETKKKI